jgi:hypothetical protein
LRNFRRTDGKLLFDLIGAAGVERIAVKADSSQLATGDAAGVVRCGIR